jgi:hypothetical protein
MRPGRQLAHNGTLFLDEIGDLPLDLQSKLLRVLQEGEFERIGSSHTQKVNVRIVAATHKDLARAVANGEFRDDLYYRLSVFPIRLPSLRERREDIPALVWFVIQKRQRAMHRWIKVVPDSVMASLQNHSWPGNVRELENVIERALIHSTGHTLRLLDDSFEAPAASRPPEDANTLSAVERTHIEGVLRDCRWRINGPGNLLMERNYTLAVKPATQILARRTVRPIARGESLTLSNDLFTDLVPGTGSVSVSVGVSTALDAAALLAALDRYPFGCSEQITSRALPLLYVNDLASEAQLSLDTAIDQLSHAAHHPITSPSSPRNSFRHERLSRR